MYVIIIKTGRNSANRSSEIEPVLLEMFVKNKYKTSHDVRRKIYNIV